jgi:protein gp37
MGENSKIEWCDCTFNPWIGCEKVSCGCDHCYAEALAKRTGSPELWRGERRRSSVENWQLPIKWNRVARESGIRKRVFCASLADVFDNQIDAQWRLDLWDLIFQCRHLDWLLLTKRPQNMEKMLPRVWGSGWTNVWLGVTAENQEEAARRIPILCGTPAKHRFLSCEPLLGPIDLNRLRARPRLIDGDSHWEGCLTGRRFDPETGAVSGMPRVDWVIAGGESGNGARPAHPEWFRQLRRQCAAAGVPFFFKQWGDWAPIAEWSCDHRRQCAIGLYGMPIDDDVNPDHVRGQRFVRVGKHAAGARLDEWEYRAFPAALDIAPAVGRVLAQNA